MTDEDNDTDDRKPDPRFEDWPDEEVTECYRKHPGDFYGWPTNEQKEYFKRGGR